MINSGADWEEKIREHFNKARIAVLMVSPAFLVSEFIRNKEIPELLEAAAKDHARILWIPVKTSQVDKVYFELKNGDKIHITKYQAVCDISTPLENMKLNERNKIYNKLCNDIRRYFPNDD